MTTVKEPPTGPKPASFLKSVISQFKPQRHSEAANKPSDKRKSNSCQFTFADGRQCRNPAKVYPPRRNVYQQDELSPLERVELSPVRDRKVNPVQLCAHHAPKQKRGAKRLSDASALEALCSDLTTATSINRSLAQTFLLMAQGRISRKDAVAFGYLSQLLLQTVSGVRAEYVAANGYRQWENKLKSSLGSNESDDDDPGPGGGGAENVEHPVNGVVEPTKSERPLAERIMGEPDYADILSRWLDMLDRKYDFTPEGRCEAKKLALELELMKPAPAKPAKDFFGQTVALVRRFRDAERQDSDAASIPPALDYYGRPIKMYVEPPPWEDKQDALPPAHGTVPKTQQSCAPSASDPADFVAPPSKRRRKPRSHSSVPGSAPHSELPLPLPTSAPAAKHDSLGGPDDTHHEGHRTDWYAPLSWSKIRPPDPFPSHKEKLRRKIRGLNNSAFRRLQHQNSRGFWNKSLQKLTP